MAVARDAATPRPTEPRGAGLRRFSISFCGAARWTPPTWTQWLLPGVQEQTLEELGLRPRYRAAHREGAPGKWTVLCPRCRRRNAYCHEVVGRERPVVRCTCGAATPLLDVLAARVGGLDEARRWIWDRARELARRPVSPRTVQTGTRRPHPPHDEVMALLGSCARIGHESVAREWIEARRIDSQRVEDLGLAGLLPASPRGLPWWGRMGRQPWTECGLRLILPMRDASGDIVSVHARAIAPTEPGREAGNPAGYTVAGTVMADDLACRMLSGAALDDGTPVVHVVRRSGLIIVQGGVEFLREATREVVDPAPAVLGVIPGSWTPELAARVTEGVAVEVRMGGDPASQRFAERICASLAGRGHVRKVACDGRTDL